MENMKSMRTTEKNVLSLFLSLNAYNENPQIHVCGRHLYTQSHTVVNLTI